jgi:hypothetical protein
MDDEEPEVKLWRVKHTLHGKVVFSSPIFTADNEIDAGIKAHAMRCDADADWPLIGDPPEGHDETVERVWVSDAYRP